MSSPETISVCPRRTPCEQVTTAYNLISACIAECAEEQTSASAAVVRLDEAAEHPDMEIRLLGICGAEQTRLILSRLEVMQAKNIKEQENLGRLILTGQPNYCPSCPLLQLDLNIPEAQ